MNKYVTKPKAEPLIRQGRYERYNLKENPFPAAPFVNPESSDSRTNGDIYEPSIRMEEYRKIQENFLEASQSDPNHLRLGYIMDTSYIGRGNGKSAFLVNLQKTINKDFGLTISKGLNKCFAITLVPESGGKTKTFESFVDLFANGIFRSNIINDCLAILRLEAISSLHKDFSISTHFADETQIREKLNSDKWFIDNNIDFDAVHEQVLRNPYLQNMPHDFPLYSYYYRPLFTQVSDQTAYIDYYRNTLKRGNPKFEFVFSHLVNLFLAANFNGAYIFIDDFERIPDFQTERQKRDFALELRTCLFDGLYTNARTGFYVMLFVLHAGVPRLIQSAWDQSGLEHRSPIAYKGLPKHVIRFDNITLEDTFRLIGKYLQEYRIEAIGDKDALLPFTKDSVKKMAELSGFNASKTLKMAYETLEYAVDQDVSQIDSNFVVKHNEAITTTTEQKQASGIHDAPTKDLLQEA